MLAIKIIALVSLMLLAIFCFVDTYNSRHKQSLVWFIIFRMVLPFCVGAMFSMLLERL